MSELGKLQTYILPVTLTDQEMRVKAGDLARKIDELGKLVVSKKDAMKAFKESQDELENSISELARHVREKKEDRPVEVRLRPAPGATIEIIREDTGEVVQTRQMTPAERQGNLGAEFEEEGRVDPLPRRPRAVPDPKEA